MRFILSTIIALFVSVVFFLIIKFWGLSQSYIDYNHSFYKNLEIPVTFTFPNEQSFESTLNTQQSIYLPIAITADQKIVIHFHDEATFIRNKTWAELSSDPASKYFLLSDYAHILKTKKILFKLTENPMSGPDIILEDFEKFGLLSGENMIFTGSYEAPLKELKSKKPEWLFGASQPEILKIKAMESLYLIESATYRADFIIHPLTYYKRPFFTEALMTDLKRRFKRVIIGPLEQEELNEALKLNPFGVIQKN